ncbi:chorismate--pyruvate lyase family protein [Neptuniibacter halophilus]|uniref:chorismate--pyruvate lyase family protein n=1 Tax=Neptuniibacter halophilus TaxID=651666 RepID=UPI002574080B|nr:chorismate lyase [Neptuniibacter halophilus]
MPVKAALTRQNFDTRWTAFRRPYAQVAPRNLRTWLTDSGSLTQRLVNLSNGEFRVEVVSQGSALPTRSEARLLGLKPRRKALVREVHLIGCDQIWVFARTVVPFSSLRGTQRRLRLLGNRSLGSLLFSTPGMRRGPLQISRLQLADRRQVWARRSVFYLAGQPLLVSEVFLPELLQVK